MKAIYILPALVTLAFLAIHFSPWESNPSIEYREQLSDSEIVEISILRLMESLESRNVWRHSGGDDRMWRVAPYSGAEEFHTENPNCCNLDFEGPEGFEPSLWQRYWYNYRGYLTINYTQRECIEDYCENVDRTHQEFVDKNGNPIAQLME